MRSNTSCVRAWFCQNPLAGIGRQTPSCSHTAAFHCDTRPSPQVLAMSLWVIALVHAACRVLCNDGTAAQAVAVVQLLVTPGAPWLQDPLGCCILLVTARWPLLYVACRHTYGKGAFGKDCAESMNMKQYFSLAAAGLPRDDIDSLTCCTFKAFVRGFTSSQSGRGWWHTADACLIQ